MWHLFGCVYFIAYGTCTLLIILTFSAALAFEWPRLHGTSLSWCACACIVVSVLFQDHDIYNTTLASGCCLEPSLYRLRLQNPKEGTSEVAVRTPSKGVPYPFFQKSLPQGENSTIIIWLLLNERKGLRLLFSNRENRCTNIATTKGKPERYSGTESCNKTTVPCK